MFYQFSHPATADYFLAEQGENFSFPAHIHECFEIIWVDAGKMQVSVGGAEIVLRAGQAVLIFPNQHHSMESRSCRHRLCIFSPKLVPAFTAKRAKSLPSQAIFTPPAALLEALYVSDNTIRRKGLLYLLCDEFDRGREYRTWERRGGEPMEKIFRFIERNYKERCTLQALAAELGYDYAYLSRYFKKTVGMGFNCYVNCYRLNHACFLFDNGKTEILECAAESGYESVRSFNRNFKAHFGLTPHEYLKRNQKTDVFSQIN